LDSLLVLEHNLGIFWSNASQRVKASSNSERYKESLCGMYGNVLCANPHFFQ